MVQKRGSCAFCVMILVLRLGLLQLVSNLGVLRMSCVRLSQFLMTMFYFDAGYEQTLNVFFAECAGG